MLQKKWIPDYAAEDIKKNPNQKHNRRKFYKLFQYKLLEADNSSTEKTPEDDKYGIKPLSSFWVLFFGQHKYFNREIENMQHRNKILRQP